MARQWRIEYKGALYHVLSRGNQRQPIFRDDNDRTMFLDIIAEASERFLIEIYAYVLMENHYHLLFKTVEPNLSKTMQWIGTTYTRRFNLRHGESGHLFQGRFKSIIVGNDAYLSQLSYYIHRNPLRAGMVDRLADYQWSSYNAYAYKKKKPDWLKTDLILSQSGAKDKHRAYRLKVQRYSEEKTKIWEDVRHGLIYGSETFIKKIRIRFLKNGSEAELPQHNRLRRDMDREDILRRASSAINCDPSIFSKPGRLPEAIKKKRDMMIYYLWKHSGMNNRQVGEVFGLTYSSVSKIVKSFRNENESNRELVKRYEDVISQFKV
ncbi:MAG: transposase [Desulfobacteraceae bacterium]|nr:transposase [Desulfobacteraceae bacterium]MBC2719933.1 transposase [Desulfobacteraceae bacterium]